MFAKALLKLGFQQFFVVQRDEKSPPKMITGISGFGFFVQKWPFRDGYLFSAVGLLKPKFYSVLGARLLGQVVKNEKSWTPKIKAEKIDW